MVINLKKLDFSLVPILLGVVLEPIAEHNFRNSMAMSKGAYSIFITRPISLIFISLAIISVLVVLIRRMKEVYKGELIDEKA